MSKIFRLNEVAVRCPLCLNHFVKKYDGMRHCFILVCDKDNIAIRCDDPFVGRWEEAKASAGKIPCPVCDTDMRYFATSTGRGYMKAKCPKKKCQTVISTTEPDGPRGVAPEVVQ